MPEKKKPRDWKDVHTALAALAMTLLLTLWNTLANHDRHKSQTLISASDSVTIVSALTDGCSSVSPANNLGTRCMTVTSTRSS